MSVLGDATAGSEVSDNKVERPAGNQHQVHRDSLTRARGAYYNTLACCFFTSLAHQRPHREEFALCSRAANLRRRRLIATKCLATHPKSSSCHPRPGDAPAPCPAASTPAVRPVKGRRAPSSRRRSPTKMWTLNLK